MIEQKEHFHGSDLEKIEKIYGIKKENIVSFAANVNPLGESGKLKTALSERIDAITKYPDREYTSLRKAIGSYCKLRLQSHNSRERMHGAHLTFHSDYSSQKDTSA